MTMKLVNVSQAKAQLSSLIEAAELGEQVLIMRGSRPAVTLMKVTEEDLSFHPEVPIEALNDFEAEIERERGGAGLLHLGSTGSEAATQLKAW
jgi:antitoxin (DNA-binding transcriptional repressor) of toxin-antitoxin stability system